MELCILLIKTQNGTTTLENNQAFPQNDKHIKLFVPPGSRGMIQQFSS